MEDYPNDAMRTASPESVFQAQRKPSDKAIDAMKQWRDKEASSELEKEWCDAAIQAMKDAQKEEEW